MPGDFDRALAARRQLQRVVFKEALDDWRDLVRDLVALANSGGGVILLLGERTAAPTRAEISERIRELTGSEFAAFEIVGAVKDGREIVALLVGEAEAPLVFTGGTIYVRHGGRSEPATSRDLEQASARRLKAVRKSFLQAVKRVVEAPPESLAFAHKTLYGTRRYSRMFLDWLIGQATRDPQFFDETRRRFSEQQRAGAGSAARP